MRSPLVLLALVVALAAGCDKDKGGGKAPAKTPSPVTAGTIGTDGVRRIPVTADKNGYTPAEISVKPNEKVVLVFTRMIEGECLSQVKVADGATVDLPMNKPTDIAVTAPASGKLTFACGMDMFQGTIVVAGT